MKGTLALAGVALLCASGTAFAISGELCRTYHAEGRPAICVLAQRHVGASGQS